MPPSRGWGSLMLQFSARGQPKAADDARRYRDAALAEEQAKKRDREARDQQAQQEGHELRLHVAPSRAAHDASELAWSAWANLSNTYSVGTTVRAKVTSVEEVGVVVEFEHLVGLVPTSLVDEPPPKNPRDLVAIGDVLDCVIMEFNAIGRR